MTMLVVAQNGTKPKDVAATAPPAPIALTEAETKEVSDAVTLAQNRLAEYRAVVSEATTADLKCETALAVLGKLQRTFERYMAADQTAALIRDKHRAVRNCADCDYTPGFRGLVHPAKQ
jgi:hypothetical protein